MGHYLKSVLMAITVTASVLVLGACTQLPTEKQSVSDMRPSISFKAIDDRVKGATVMVDGLNMGLVGSYIDGVAALRILPGTHLLTVVAGGQIVFEEKFYVGDGVSRTFVVN